MKQWLISSRALYMHNKIPTDHDESVDELESLENR